MTPRILYRFPDRSGESFRPSNGTEGMVFDEEFCGNCIHQNPNPEAGKNCEVCMKAWLYDEKDKEYPSEWVYDQEGWPVCTAWQKWDWGNDGDPNDPDNPKAPPPPPDPNQLSLFPLYPDERDYEDRQEHEVLIPRGQA